AALVADPDFVDLFVLARHDTLDDLRSAGLGLAAGAEGDVTAHRAMIADGSGRREFPGARAKAEVGGGQRPHRADIGGVARPLRVKARIGERDNFQLAAALVKTEHMVVGNFVLKTGTARALNTALT